MRSSPRTVLDDVYSGQVQSVKRLCHSHCCQAHQVERGTLERGEI